MSLDSNATLLPCPFCPKSKLVIANKSEVDECEHAEHCNGCGSNPDNDDYVAVFCDATIGGCGACGGYASTKARAIARWNARSQPSEWVATSERKPKCSKKPNSAGTPVLVYPPYNEDGYSEMHYAFYGCRQTDEPNFYIFGRVFYPTHWMPLPKPPALLPPETEAK